MALGILPRCLSGHGGRPCLVCGQRWLWPPEMQELPSDVGSESLMKASVTLPATPLPGSWVLVQRQPPPPLVRVAGEPDADDVVIDFRRFKEGDSTTFTADLEAGESLIVFVGTVDLYDWKFHPFQSAWSAPVERATV